MKQEGLNSALQRAADLLEAASRLRIAKAGEVDTQDGLTAMEAAQDTLPTTLAEGIARLRMSPDSAQKSTGLRQEHLRRPTKEPRPQALY